MPSSCQFSGQQRIVTQIRHKDGSKLPLHVYEFSHVEAKQDIRVKLQYLKDDPIYDTQKPLQVTPNFADREGRTNVRLSPGEFETILDVRGSEKDFSLDEHGFVYVRAPTEFTEWSSQPKIAERYLPELETLLRSQLGGCDEIMFYDARIRQAGDEGVRVSGLSHNPFARQVHTDNTERSVIEKIRNLTDMKADYLLNGRYRIINIWRPIKHPVYDCGLAIADGGKLLKDDVIECDRVRQDTGQYWDTMGVIKYRAGYKWYYMSKQDEPEVLLFKNWDSATDVNARYCLHTAFDMPEDAVMPNTPTRESIEVRALVFTYPADQRRPPGEWEMPQPLTKDLHRNRLKRLYEEPKIAGTTRTDIDEGDEVKDALLLLRRNQIQSLEREMDAHIEEYQNLNAENVELRVALASSKALHQEQVSHIEQMNKELAEKRIQIASMTTMLEDAQVHLRGYVCHAHSNALYVGEDASSGIRESSENKPPRSRKDNPQCRDQTLLCTQRAQSQLWQDTRECDIQNERTKGALMIEHYNTEMAKLVAENAKLKARCDSVW